MIHIEVVTYAGVRACVSTTATFISGQCMSEKRRRARLLRSLALNGGEASASQSATMATSTLVALDAALATVAEFLAPEGAVSFCAALGKRNATPELNTYWECVCENERSFLRQEDSDSDEDSDEDADEDEDDEENDDGEPEKRSRSPSTGGAPGSAAGYADHFREHLAEHYLQRQRRDKLSVELDAHGLELRADSYTCARFINGASTDSLKTVVNTMVEMAFYFEKTQYSFFRTEILDQIHEHAHR